MGGGRSPAGGPAGLHELPATREVAQFIGDANFVPGLAAGGEQDNSSGAVPLHLGQGRWRSLIARSGSSPTQAGRDVERISTTAGRRLHRRPRRRRRRALAGIGRPRCARGRRVSSGSGRRRWRIRPPRPGCDLPAGGWRRPTCWSLGLARPEWARLHASSRPAATRPSWRSTPAAYGGMQPLHGAQVPSTCGHPPPCQARLCRRALLAGRPPARTPCASWAGSAGSGPHCRPSTLATPCCCVAAGALRPTWVTPPGHWGRPLEVRSASAARRSAPAAPS